eukprot:TRINITY_DN13322_c0_g1_i2.p2 TRINITY_DN13322_c0_g1~~TRINITY_DN13322_c0_g1_i2.p2  ORF type:complete len:308 (+),score=86.60 TRINITY_DN13322_c0_g1_i2:73-924(+)
MGAQMGGEEPPAAPAAAGPIAVHESQPQGRRGSQAVNVVVRDPEGAARSLIGAEFSDDLRLLRVRKGRPAESHGLQRFIGWRLANINWEPVTSVEQLHNIAVAADHQPLCLRWVHFSHCVGAAARAAHSELGSPAGTAAVAAAAAAGAGDDIADRLRLIRTAPSAAAVEQVLRDVAAEGGGDVRVNITLYFVVKGALEWGLQEHRVQQVIAAAPPRPPPSPPGPASPNQSTQHRSPAGPQSPVAFSERESVGGCGASQRSAHSAGQQRRMRQQCADPGGSGVC